MAKLYTTLTEYIPLLRDDNFGKWMVDRENDGTLEHPIYFPFVSYSAMVRNITDDIYSFEREHPEYDMKRYGQILEESNIKWEMESMLAVDTSKMDGRTIMAMLMGAVRAERFCDGALLDFYKSGCILKWLDRLNNIE